MTIKSPSTRFALKLPLRNRKTVLFLWLPLAVLLGALLLLGSLMLSIASDASLSSASSADVSAPADAAIVLGTTARGDQPSPVFKERIKHAINLYHANSIRFLLFTGGAGPDETLPEAEVARRYAVAHGVDPGRILLETRSRTTFENLREAKKLIDDRPDLRRFLIVSDPLHMKRSLAIARHLGLDAIPSPTPTTRYKTWRSKTGFLFHETWFYLTYRVRHLFGCEK